MGYETTKGGQKNLYKIVEIFLLKRILEEFFKTRIKWSQK